MREFGSYPVVGAFCFASFVWVCLLRIVSISPSLFRVFVFVCVVCDECDVYRCVYQVGAVVMELAVSSRYHKTTVTALARNRYKRETSILNYEPKIQNEEKKSTRRINNPPPPPSSAKTHHFHHIGSTRPGGVRCGGARQPSAGRWPDSAVHASFLACPTLYLPHENHFPIALPHF